MTGEVAGLWPKEELDGILNDVRLAYKQEHRGKAHVYSCLSYKDVLIILHEKVCVSCIFWLVKATIIPLDL